MVGTININFKSYIYKKSLANFVMKRNVIRSLLWVMYIIKWSYSWWVRGWLVLLLILGLSKQSHMTQWVLQSAIIWKENGQQHYAQSRFSSKSSLRQHFIWIFLPLALDVMGANVNNSWYALIICIPESRSISKNLFSLLVLSLS